MIFNEDEEQIIKFPIFNTHFIVETEIRDYEVIQILSKDNEDIAIYGLIRGVHFGRRMYKQFMGFKCEQLKDKMFEIILKVNYQIPNYDLGSIMKVGNAEGDEKIMKLLTNTTDCIVDKYDYILLHTSKEQPIMITNEILNSMLPSNWQLVDEFTVVAPITSQSEWDKLLANAQKQDLYEHFINR